MVPTTPPVDLTSPAPPGLQHLASVAAIVAEELAIPGAAVVPQATLEGLGADELDRVWIFQRVERAYGLHIPREEEVRVITVGDLLALLHRRTAPEAGGPGYHATAPEDRR